MKYFNHIFFAERKLVYLNKFLEKKDFKSLELDSLTENNDYNFEKLKKNIQTIQAEIHSLIKEKFDHIFRQESFIKSFTYLSNQLKETNHSPEKILDQAYIIYNVIINSQESQETKIYYYLFLIKELKNKYKIIATNKEKTNETEKLLYILYFKAIKISKNHISILKNIQEDISQTNLLNSEIKNFLIEHCLEKILECSNKSDLIFSYYISNKKETIEKIEKEIFSLANCYLIPDAENIYELLELFEETEKIFTKINNRNEFYSSEKLNEMKIKKDHLNFILNEFLNLFSIESLSMVLNIKNLELQKKIETVMDKKIKEPQSINDFLNFYVKNLIKGRENYCQQLFEKIKEILLNKEIDPNLIEKLLEKINNSLKDKSFLKTLTPKQEAKIDKLQSIFEKKIGKNNKLSRFIKQLIHKFFLNFSRI